MDRVLLLDKNGKVTLDCDTDTPEEMAWREKNRLLSDHRNTKDRSFGKEPVVEIEDLNFAYPVPGKKKEKGRPIIQNLSMDIFKQEFLAIVGENGVGKTTLMKLIFKVNKPDSGEIRVFEKSLKSYRTRDLYREMGLVFQNPENQFITNTVFDEMMFSLKRVNISREEKEARVRRMLEQFHLEQEKEKNPFTLSQGQKRRLSVASMLLTNQKILFLDEPTYGQDFENRQELMKDMQQLVENGITIVMITHDLELVKQYATRVVRIEKGTVVKDMPVADYFA